MNRNWIFVFAVTLHLLWGVLLLWDGVNAAFITAIHTSLNIFGNRVLLGTLYLAASGLVCITHFCGTPSLKNVWLVLPQQFMLMVSALGACIAIWKSQFADGVDRPRAFIMADQAPAILMAIFHTMALLEIYVWNPWKKP